MSSGRIGSDLTPQLGLRLRSSTGEIQMTMKNGKLSPFRDERNECIDISLVYPVIRFPKWVVLVWRVHGKSEQSEQIALSFYAREPVGMLVPRHRFYLRNISEEVENPLSPLWRQYPGMRLALALQLLLFHELPPVIKQPMERFAFRELEQRNPHLCHRLRESLSEQ